MKRELRQALSAEEGSRKWVQRGIIAVVVVATVPHEKRGGVAQAVLGASALCCLVQAFVYP